MPGYSGAQCAGGSSWVPNWSVAIAYARRLEAVLGVRVRHAGVGSTAGVNVAGPNPFHTGMFGVMWCVRSM